MSDLAFFRAAVPLSLGAVAAGTGAILPADADPTRMISVATTLSRA